MELIDIILHRTDISSAIATLYAWNSKKPNARAKEMSERLEESLKGFDWLEQEVITSRQYAKHLESELRNLELQNRQKDKRIEELKEINKRLSDGL